MSKTLTEKKVLKRLGIPDFRHMTKDKVVRFASMFPRMDPEIAKKALEQFPEFASFAKEIVSIYSDVAHRGLASNDDSMQSFSRTCDSIIATLEKQLEDGELSFEEKSVIIDKMVYLAGMKSAKDTENKQFILDMTKAVGFCLLFAGAIAAALLGLQTDTLSAPTSDDSDDSDSCDDPITVDYEFC